MNNIEDFIALATKTIGADSTAAQSATGSLLGFLQKQLADGTANDLFAQFGGAADLAATAGAQDSSGGGLMGSLTQMAGSLFGDKAGDALDLASSLKGSGLSFSQVPSFVSAFVTYVSENASPELLDQILEQVPELKKLMGN